MKHNLQTTSHKLAKSIAAAMIVLTVAAALPALADSIPGTVSTDPFDSTQGTVIINDDTIVDPINVFRTSGDFEDGHTLMANGGLNSVSFIEFQTGDVVNLAGIRLFAANDGVGLSFRRTMNRFRLLADVDADGSYETVVIDQAITPDYSLQPGNAAGAAHELDLTLGTGSTVTAQDWRLEVTQGSNIQPFEGARVVEVDAIVADVPIPTLNVWGMIIASCLLALAAFTVLLRREEM